MFDTAMRDMVVKRIREILDESSGGIKMPALIAELTHWIMTTAPETVETEVSGFVSDVDELLRTLELENIHVLTYDWEMGHGVTREKKFVYTKFN